MYRRVLITVGCLQRYLLKLRLLKISLLLMTISFGLGFTDLKLLAIVIQVTALILCIISAVSLILRL